MEDVVYRIVGYGWFRYDRVAQEFHGDNFGTSYSATDYIPGKGAMVSIGSSPAVFVEDKFYDDLSFVYHVHDMAD